MHSDETSFVIHLPQTPAQGNPANPATEPTQSRQRSCGICGTVGHNRRTCPSQQLEEVLPPTVPVPHPVGAGGQGGGFVPAVAILLEADEDGANAGDGEDGGNVDEDEPAGPLLGGELDPLYQHGEEEASEVEPVDAGPQWENWPNVLVGNDDFAVPGEGGAPNSAQAKGKAINIRSCKCC